MEPYQSLPWAYRGKVLLGIQWPLFALATMLVGCRLAVRISRKSHGWDDFFIYLAWILSLYTSILYQLNVQAGAGHHILYLVPYPANLQRSLLVAELTAIQSPLGIAFVKISVIIFVLRLVKKSPKMKYIAYLCYVNLVIFIPVSIAAFLIQCLKCRPLYLAWTLPNPMSGPHCISPSVNYNVNTAQATVSAVSDFLTAILPVLILRGLQLSRKKKIGLCVITGLGSLISGFAIARAVTGKQVLSSPDPTYSTIIIAILADAEQLGGIIVACLPITVPILLSIKKVLGIPISRSSQSRSKRRSRQRVVPEIDKFVRKNPSETVSSDSHQSWTSVPLVDRHEQYYPGYGEMKTADPADTAPADQTSPVVSSNPKDRIWNGTYRTHGDGPRSAETPVMPAPTYGDRHGRKQMGSWLQTEEV